MTRGVRIVNLQPGDSVAAVAVMNHEDLGQGADGVVNGEELPAENSPVPESMSTPKEQGEIVNA
jgi:hypothetical protein